MRRRHLWNGAPWLLARCMAERLKTVLQMRHEIQHIPLPAKGERRVLLNDLPATPIHLQGSREVNLHISRGSTDLRPGYCQEFQRFGNTPYSWQENLWRWLQNEGLKVRIGECHEFSIDWLSKGLDVG
mmetsp:Transcript_5724/g.9080  ORF Transcript_5724/g.9080 Transcript_5724/m.9080 type:complete len:128 (+) Transcript_5724:1129-1512(+)